MTDCPCGSGQTFETCCAPLLDGAPAPTAEALMRSRFTAYVKARYQYIEDTHATEAKGDFDPIEAARNNQGTTWKKLEIRATEAGGPDDETGVVEFVATFAQNGQTHAHHERSTFRRENGRWAYVDGIIDPKARIEPVRVQKVGRNEPCPCGSGKKYKKCCGA